MDKMIVGLGNPGIKHSTNRHNSGFIVVDGLAELKGASWSMNKKILSEVAVCKDDNLILVKPQTFMNSSGDAVSRALKYFNISPVDIIIVHDDVDLEILDIRVSQNSSSAGHHGVQDIIDKLGTQNFTRLRIGVGRPTQNSRNVEKYVLSDFTTEELASVKKKGVEQLLSSLRV